MATISQLVVPLVLSSGTPHQIPSRSDPRGLIFAEDSGVRNSGFTLICVPGIGDVRTSFRFIGKTFQDSHRIIVTDIRGFGDSHSFSKFSPEDVAEDMKCVMEYFKLEAGVVFVTNSLSTGSAVIVATEGSPAVKGIVLLGPILRDLPADKYFRPISHCLFAWPWGAPLWSSYYKGLFKRRVRPVGFDEHASHIRAALRRPGALRSVGAFARAPKRGVEARLPRVRVPALAVFGDSDPDYPDAAAEEAWLKAAMAGGRLTTVMLKEVGHYPHVEAAEEALAAVRDFLASL